MYLDALEETARNFGIVQHHLRNLNREESLPENGFIVNIKSFYDNNFLTHFGAEAELRLVGFYFYISRSSINVIPKNPK